MFLSFFKYYIITKYERYKAKWYFFYNNYNLFNLYLEIHKRIVSTHTLEIRLQDIHFQYISLGNIRIPCQLL